MPFEREPPEVVKNLRDELLTHSLDLTELARERAKAAGQEEAAEEAIAKVDKKILAKLDAIRRCKENLREAEHFWFEERRKGR